MTDSNSKNIYRTVNLFIIHGRTIEIWTFQSTIYSNKKCTYVDHLTIIEHISYTS